MASTSDPPKPIRVWITPPGPNPWKTIFLLEELNLNYEIKSFRFDDVKKVPFIKINPNGRVPAIEDPNTNLTLWESGAINQYLIEQYDTENRLSYDTLIEKNLCNQYLHFQMSGQGPYFGQCGWFQHLHPEKIQSAIDRYANEIKRVLSVLETVLSAKFTDEQWLVGNKMTYADMAFVPWNFRLSEVLLQSWDEVFDGTPRVRAWHEKMVELPSWKRAMEHRARLMDGQGLQWNGVPKGIENFTEYEEKIQKGEIKYD
ncbi:putative glutathione S-transferase [Podospora fimiseda]|uniref:glutathione transferase n=1 Tax=Podospora fimiseda TaxID=252190 RepID=A0AAN7BED5_9PEZI|nr:putative glutathione S-transferase [Podospora fimiseda]